jgi:hypothetical protein
MIHDEQSGNPDENEPPELSEVSTGKLIARAGMQAIGGAIPFVGGLLSAAAAAWSEHDQEKINHVFKQWLQMLEDELQEKAKTIIEIMTRLDMNDEEIQKRVESPEYQELLKSNCSPPPVRPSNEVGTFCGGRGIYA